MLREGKGTWGCICCFLFSSPLPTIRHFDRRRRTLPPQRRNPLLYPSALPARICSCRCLLLPTPYSLYPVLMPSKPISTANAEPYPWANNYDPRHPVPTPALNTITELLPPPTTVTHHH